MFSQWILVILALSGACIGENEFCQIEEGEAATCKNDHSGVYVNGICYYLSSSRDNWNDAQEQCYQEDGNLAQIQTSTEYSAISAYLLDNDGTDIWISLKKDYSDVVPKFGLVLESTYWYTNNGTSVDKNLELSAGKTWVQMRQTDDAVTVADEPLWQCFVLFRDTDNVVKVGNHKCDASSRALCQLKNPERVFVHIPYKCAGNTYKYFRSPQIRDLSDCNEACINDPPCRGVNYFRDAPEKWCELTSWSIGDDSSFEYKQGCFHYTAVY